MIRLVRRDSARGSHRKTFSEALISRIFFQTSLGEEDVGSFGLEGEEGSIFLISSAEEAIRTWAGCLKKGRTCITNGLSPWKRRPLVEKKRFHFRRGIRLRRSMSKFLLAFLPVR